MLMPVPDDPLELFLILRKQDGSDRKMLYPHPILGHYQPFKTQFKASSQTPIYANY